MEKFIKQLKDNIVLKIIFSVVFSMLTTLGGYVSGNRLFSGTFVYILVFCLKTILIYALLTAIYYLLDKANVRMDKKELPHVFLLSFLILIVFYSIEFMGLYPGIFSYDVSSQLEMYMGDKITEWHPVIHTFILGKIFEIGYSLGLDFAGCSAAYSVFQYVVIALCFSYVLKYVYIKSHRKCIWAVCALFLGAFPTISLQTLSCTKDSFFMALFALSMTVTIEFIESPEVFFEKKRKAVLWVASTFLMIIFRNNCIYAAPVLLLLVIGFSNKKKQSVYMALSVVVLLVLYKLLFVNLIVSYSTDEREKYPMVAQQLAHIYMDDNAKLSDEERQIIRNLFYIDLGFDYYCESIADPVKVSIDMDYFNEHKSLVWKCYLSAVIHNPGLAMEAFLKLTCGFWYPVYDLTLDWTGLKGYWEVGDYLRCNLYPKNMPLYRFYSFFDTTSFSMHKLTCLYLLFAPATFLYIFLLFFSYAVKQKNKAYLIVYVFALIYWCTFLFGPAVMVRYTTYMYAILPLHLCLIGKQNG